MRPLLRYLWASPNTLLGLLFAALALATGGRVRFVRGVLEAHGGALGPILRRCVLLRGGVMAVTLGHVIVGGSAAALDVAREHEHVHVRQYERWGPLFLPAYVFASIVAAARGGRLYRDNTFEREAYERGEGRDRPKTR